MRTPLVICIALIATQLHDAQAADPQSPVFKAGFAERDITPEIGMEQPGGYGKSFHRTFHDACKVRAAVFDDGQSRVAIVGIDAAFIYRPVVLAVRQAIEKKCGIPADSILISASRSHSSGPMGMLQPGEFDFASPLVKSLAYEKSSCADPKYLARVEQQLVDAVCAADHDRVDARAGVGKGIENQGAFNRRFRMKSGLTATHPGQMNPDIIEPAGPVDPEVGVLGAWNSEGKLLGCIVNFACHATTNPGGISANYIHDLEKAVLGYFGPKTVVVFLPGACGDITQVDNQSPSTNRLPEDWCRFVGGRVGAEAVKVLLSIDPGALVPVKSTSTVLHIKRRVPSPQRVERAMKLVTQDPKKVDATDWAFAKETVLLDALLSKHPVAEAEVQAVQLGPAVFLSDPAEFFCQFGLDIKAGSKFPFTFPVELANGCVGYVPTEEALGPRGGGYETRLTAYSNLEPTAGRQMVDAALELAAKLQPGAVPARAKLPPARKGPWSYGNVPPELN
jgi:hypothetical protein